MEKWYAFHAFNSQSYYGYGTAAEAEAYCHDQLNPGRVINFYAARPITTDEYRFTTDGFSLAIALADAAEST